MTAPLAIMPNSRRRISTHPAAGLPDVEHVDDAVLLAVVLDVDAQGAADLLDRAGGLKALLRDAGAPPEHGRRLRAAVELGRRALVAQWHPVRLKTPREVYEFLLPHLGGRREERFHVVGLDSRNGVLADASIGQGSVDSVQVDPREVFSRAIAWRAAGLIVSHCHPSGDPEPSAHDIAMTRQLADGAKLLGIRLLDHLIVGDGRYVSLQERGAFP